MTGVAARVAYLAGLYAEGKAARGSVEWPAALCAQADPEAWFPGKGKAPRAAQRICRACPIVAGCLVAAIDMGPQAGVLGSATERERKALLAHLNRSRGGGS